ncbi:SMODS domain-containing nucleotidyltransferase [Sphingobacterium sp.]|uniref:SMODS domain-containing nucleotidyltransferase n=1 Tax=Sphingobacterium sp. TaxID=341027 RepID=UPI00289A9393|nr:nucleotidyltransferase domain-containing protein [Sphingobacterium sp.]
MNTAQIFGDFITNITVENQTSIETRFGTITKRLNADFHDLTSESENGIYVGSYGRDTAIQGISDLDLLFVLPDHLYKKYNDRKGNVQSQLLQDVSASIAKTYSTSKVRGDGQVVVVEFANDYIEVCPAFQESDGSFTYPDSNKGGKWKKTNPLPEAKTLRDFDKDCNGNLIYLCRFTRAWKNKCGVKIGGLLIDTFAYNFFKANSKYKDYELEQFDLLIRDFFKYLSELDADRSYWYAPGSNQHVYKKNSNFKSKAKKALKNVEEAIEKEENSTVYEIWRRVFGKAFPYPQALKEASYNFSESEQFIQQEYPINISYRLRIDCQITQEGYRSELLRSTKFLKKNKNLVFFIDHTDVSKPYKVLWKVKNEGKIAHDRMCLRGGIIESNMSDDRRKEDSNFEGPHFVECYIIKNGYCVARDRIDVPISNS